MANFNDQLQRMKSLMTYGAVNEKKEQNCGAMEYHAIGADGKSYGIIRENQKFYIKVAPKNKEMVVESYDYIGGFNNKKDYEYNSYSKALKNFEMKMSSLREAHNASVNIESLRPFEVKGEVMTEGTKKMMAEIARQRQIMNNVCAIMNESTTISANNTGNPEAKKTAKFNDKIGKPFDVTAKAELDGDFKKTANSPEKQSAPFGDSAKAEKEKDAEYVPSGSVANQKPKGGKVVKVDESTKKIWEMMAKLDKSFTLNESCDEWGSCGLPSSEGVGSPDGHLMEDDSIAGFADEEFETSTDEFDDVEGEDEFGAEGEDEFGAEGDEDEFDVERDGEFEDLDEDTLSKLDEFDMEDEDEFGAEGEEEFDMEDENEFGADDEEFPGLDNFSMEDEDDFGISESRKKQLMPIVENLVRTIKKQKLAEEGTKLNVFGKHPGYRKKPMTLPTTGSDNENGMKDWNDESVYSEQPFGSKIGKSAPYDLVQKVTDSVMEALTGKKKN